MGMGVIFPPAGIPIGSYGDPHRNFMGMGWECKLKFNSHGNPDTYLANLKSKKCILFLLFSKI